MLYPNWGPFEVARGSTAVSEAPRGILEGGTMGASFHRNVRPVNRDGRAGPAAGRGRSDLLQARAAGGRRLAEDAQAWRPDPPGVASAPRAFVLICRRMPLLRRLGLPLAVLATACGSTTSTGTSGTSGSSGTSTGTSGTSSGAQASGSTSGASGTSTGTGSGTASGTQSGTSTGASGTASGVSGATGSGSGVSGTAGVTSGTTAGSQSGATMGDAGAGDARATEAGSTGDCAGLALCDDFESDTANGPPNASLWISWGTRGCSGSGNPAAPVIFPIAIDNTTAHSGSQSLKVEGGDSCGAFAVNTSAFSSLSSGEVYARMWVKLDATKVFTHAILLGGGLLPLADGGVGFNTLGDLFSLQPETNGGTSTSVFYWGVQDSNVMPPMNSTASASTTYLSGSGFSCLEFHVSKTQKVVETWINGTAVSGLTSTSSVNSGWAPPASLALTSLALGWADFHGPDSPAFAVWFDDVALSSTRIGCQ